MTNEQGGKSSSTTVHVVDLSRAPGEGQSWDRPKWVVYSWGVAELFFVTNPWQVSSKLRVSVLRAFGAKIGSGVVFRPRTRVRFPWKLTIGDHSWIGEGVWIHNQDNVTIGRNVVVSQETFITTGSHAHRVDMALITKPVKIDDGVWVTSRCLVTGGVHIGTSALIRPLTLVTEAVPSNVIYGAAAPTAMGPRFADDTSEIGDK